MLLRNRMPRRRKSLVLPKRKSRNKQRASVDFLDQLRSCRQRAELISNRPAHQREFKNIQAALAEGRDYEIEHLPWSMRLLRWFAALLLLPLCFVTSYTLVGEFSHETMHRGFWYTHEFWFFATGALLMSGWFYTGFFRKTFLIIYVLGHELTHAVFVLCHFGWVSRIKVSAEGGYIATNKSNLLISLSPYFFPFWSMVILAIYGITGYFTTLPHYSEEVLFALTGASWTFHMLWTLWMIPRDQPDLKENDTFFSLVVIYLANILVLSAMLCISAKSLTWQGFFGAWCINAENLYRSVITYFQQ